MSDHLAAQIAEVRHLVSSGQIHVRDDTENLPDYLKGVRATTNDGRSVIVGYGEEKGKLMDETWRIAGNCPMGCGATLFRGEGGHVTCSFIHCPRPAAVDDLLHEDHAHFVTFTEETFTIEHPLRERIEGTMTSCSLHNDLRALSGPPGLGRFRVTRRQADPVSESYRGDAIGWEFQKKDNQEDN